MITDQELTFSDAQALTATAVSTNIVDLGPLSGGNLVRDIGAGEDTWLVITVHTVLDSAAEGSTLVITLESDDVSTLSTSPTVHWTSPPLAEADLVAGHQIKVPVPSGAYQQYLGLRYTVAVEDFTSGKITAQIVRDASMRRDYATGSHSNAE